MYDNTFSSRPSKRAHERASHLSEAFVPAPLLSADGPHARGRFFAFALFILNISYRASTAPPLTPVPVQLNEPPHTRNSISWLCNVRIFFLDEDEKKEPGLDERGGSGSVCLTGTEAARASQLRGRRCSQTRVDKK
jgi:hypothetical protein